MTEEHLKQIQDAAAKLEERAKRDPAFAQRVLVEEGIYTEDGELAPEYR